MSRESNFLELSFLQSYLEPNLLVGEMHSRAIQKATKEKDKEKKRNRNEKKRRGCILVK